MFIIIIIIGIHWTQDNILCVQIIIIQALLYNETSAVDLSKPCQVWLQKLEHCSAVTTSSDREFHSQRRLFFLTIGPA